MHTVVFAVTVIDSLRTFDIVWAMTRGGPYDSTQLLSTYMFQQGFTLVNLGYGSAIAVSSSCWRSSSSSPIWPAPTRED